MKNSIASNVKYLSRTETMNQYLSEIRKSNLLTDGETEQLVKKAQAGDDNAMRKLAEANQRFIFSMAKSKGSDDNIMDLVNEGTIGLIESIQTYSETSGVKFLTYARWFILRRMTAFLSTTNVLIRKSNHLKVTPKIALIRKEFFAANGRYPSELEIVDILKERYDIKVSSMDDIYDLSINSISSTYSDDEDEMTYESSDEFTSQTASTNDYEKDVEDDYQANLVNTLLSGLKEREREIIKKLFGIGYECEYSIDDVASEFGMCTERIRQIREKALKALRSQYVAVSSRAM